MTEPNVPLFRKIFEHIDAHPEEWNQDMWATKTECGTAYCFAGFAMAFSGEDEADFGPDPFVKVGDVSHHTKSDKSIERVGREALGINEKDAETLFWARNTLDDLHSIAADICGESFR